MVSAERIAERIKRARLSQGMKREELAYRSGISIATVANMEQGKNWPRIDTLIEVAKILGLSLPALLGDDQEEVASLRPGLVGCAA